MTAGQYLASELERLMALPLDTAQDAEHWNKECANVQAALESQFPELEPEHFLWHFFTDSDIRRKDAGYRQRQHQSISDYIARLRHGS